MKPAPRVFTRTRRIDGDEHRTEVTVHASGWTTTRNRVAGNLVSVHRGRRNASDLPWLISRLVTEGYTEQVEPYSVGVHECEPALFRDGRPVMFADREDLEAAARELNRGAA